MVKEYWSVFLGEDNKMYESFSGEKLFEVL